MIKIVKNEQKDQKKSQQVNNCWNVEKIRKQQEEIKSLYALSSLELGDR